MHASVRIRRGPMLITLATAGLCTGAVAHAKPPSLTLAEAVARALAESPRLVERRAAATAAAGRTRQATLLPNPELSVEVEDFGRFGGGEDPGGVQTTVSIAQQVELFGRRAKRRDVADALHRASDARVDGARRTVMARVTRAFDAVLLARARLAITDELTALARAETHVAADRVRSGSGNPVEVPLAQAELAQARATLERRRLDVATARSALAATWGGVEADFGPVVGSLTLPARVPPLGDLRAAIDDAPDAAAWAADVEARSAAVALERVGRLPDVTVRFGGRRFHDEGTNAFVAELSVPLPLFDRRQGAIAAAAAELDATRAVARRGRVDAEGELAAAHAELTAGVTEAAVLERDAIPTAERALDAAQRAFGAGSLDQHGVIEAGRVVFELRGRRLDAVERARLAATTIDRIAGTRLCAEADGGVLP